MDIPWLTIGVLISLIWLSAERGYAENRSIKNYITQQGLPSAEVFHILQDRSGFSTSNGIASFDGYEMKALSVHDGVPGAGTPVRMSWAGSG